MGVISSALLTSLRSILALLYASLRSKVGIPAGFACATTTMATALQSRSTNLSKATAELSARKSSYPSLAETPEDQVGAIHGCSADGITDLPAARAREWAAEVFCPKSYNDMDE